MKLSSVVENTVTLQKHSNLLIRNSKNHQYIMDACCVTHFALGNEYDMKISY